MLALSIVAPQGGNIVVGLKTLEIRSWRPPQWPLRDLLLVENGFFLTGEDQVDPDGVAVAVLDIEDVRPWQASELAAACATQWQAGLWAWHVTRVRAVTVAMPVAARRKLYEVDIQPSALLLAPARTR